MLVIGALAACRSRNIEILSNFASNSRSWVSVASRRVWASLPTSLAWSALAAISPKSEGSIASASPRVESAVTTERGVERAVLGSGEERGLCELLSVSPNRPMAAGNQSLLRDSVLL